MKSFLIEVVHSVRHMTSPLNGSLMQVAFSPNHNKYPPAACAYY